MEMGMIQEHVHSLEESFVHRLNLLRKRNVDRLFWENFEEISGQIVRKVPTSKGSETAKRLVLTTYEHVCNKAGSKEGLVPHWAADTKAQLQKAIANANLSKPN